MDDTMYIAKMQDLLSADTSYKQLSKDPTRGIETTLKGKLKALVSVKEVPQRLFQILQPRNSARPQLYGVPQGEHSYASHCVNHRLTNL